MSTSADAELLKSLDNLANQLAGMTTGLNLDDLLHEAVESNDLELVLEVLEDELEDDPTRINARCTKIQWTPLHYACRHASLEIAKALVEAGADVHATAAIPSGPPLVFTPLAFATMSDKNEIAEYLLTKGALVNPIVDPEDGTTLLHYAAGLEAPMPADEAMQWLIDHGADVNVTRDHYTSTPLMRAAVLGRREVVACLVDNGADVVAPSPIGLTALHYAAFQGHADATLALLKSDKCNVDILGPHDQPPLALALLAGTPHLNTAALLLDHGANVNATMRANKETTLHGAVRVGSLEAVKLLLAAGATINAQTLDGATPLMNAAGLGKLELVRHLVDAGADTEITTTEKQTALTAASLNAHKDVVAFLETHKTKIKTTP